MKIAQSLVNGFAGALTLTVLHEAMRRIVPDAPRMDVLGMRAIAKGLVKSGAPLPSEEKLYGMAMAGDLVANSLYYSLAGTGKNAWVKGALLGLAAGAGGVALPGPLGLGEDASARTPQTKLMTVAWYLAGGLAAAAVAQVWGDKKKTKKPLKKRYYHRH
jgi:hypothetical protein